MNRRARRGVPAAAGLLAAALLAASCAAGPAPGTGLAPQLPPYDGPKARLAVARFDYKAAKGRERVGEGLADMLTTELVNSNRFMVLERENLRDILQEQDLGASGRVSAATAAPVGEVEGAELLVMGTVTAFEPNKLGLGGALLGGVTLLGTALIHAKNDWVPVGAAAYTESYLAMDVRLVDTATSRVLSSVAVEGKASDMGGGLLAEVGGGRSRLPLAFGGWQKTSAERAMRLAIARAVEGIVAAMPPEYYRHQEAFVEGQLLGFVYLDVPTAGRSAAGGGREAMALEDAAGLRQVMDRWGVNEPGMAGQVDFAREVVLAATGAEDDRGASLSIQKVLLEQGAVKVEIGVLPPPKASGEAPAEKTPATVPYLAARLPRTGSPVRVVWVDASP